MKLEPNQIHIWSINLSITTDQANEKIKRLSADERERAHRFHFEIHQLRFIAAHSALRQVLSQYLSIPAEQIVFTYGEQHKPFIANSNIQFNLAHSHDLALLAITPNHSVGIDVEKMAEDKENVAKRFFHPTEVTALQEKSENERLTAFYRIWTRKEAMVKAVGKGLSIPLSSFAVSPDANVETITLEGKTWTLQSLNINPQYAAALASDQIITSLEFCDFFEH